MNIMELSSAEKRREENIRKNREFLFVRFLVTMMNLASKKFFFYCVLRRENELVSF